MNLPKMRSSFYPMRSSLNATPEILKTTKSLFSVLLLVYSQKGQKRRIVFRNGIVVTTADFEEYLFIMKLNRLGYKVIQTVDNFKVLGNNFNATIHNYSAPDSKIRPYHVFKRIVALAEDKTEYTISQLDENLFEASCKDFKLVGHIDILDVLHEYALGTLECPCQGKTVLDVGGFEGDSAVLFSIMGARKVIVYEPVLAHSSLIKRNIDQNNVNAEIHMEGIGEKDKTQLVNFEYAHFGFGVNSKGPNTIEIALRNVSDVIANCQAEVAKFDCEDSEICLVDVPAEILRKINYYIIETHANWIRSKIIEKFCACNYKILKDIDLGTGWGGKRQYSIIHFAKQE